MNQKKPVRFIITLFLMAIAAIAFAQKPNTKSVTIKYIQPPVTPLPDNVKTYFFKVENKAAGLKIEALEVQRNFNLKGYTLAASENDADVIFQLTFNSVSYDGEVRKVDYKKKINDSTFIDKVGGEYEVKTDLNTSLFIKVLKNDKILKSGNARANSLNHTSKVYSTYNEAVAAYNKAKDTHTVELSRELAKRLAIDFSKTSNNNYGYVKKSVYVPIARGKGRKHDYSDLEQAFIEFEGAMDLANETGMTAKLKAITEECILVWEKAIKEFEPDNKKARIGDKNIGHLYFNIAAAKFALQEWQEVYALLDTVENTKGQGQISKIMRDITKELEMRHNNEPTYALGANENVQRLNYSLIYNLFMNFELTEKHQNLQVVMNYFPDYDHLPAKEIKLTTENSGFFERIQWNYGERDQLTDLTYEVDREEGRYVLYKYEMIYDGDVLTGIDITGKRKITFEYNDDGKLKSISRIKGNIIFHYLFEYADQENKADIKVVVIKGEEMRPGSSKYFVTWNDQMRISSYNLDIYGGSDFEYSESGDIISQNMNGYDNNLSVKWEYEYDEEGRWRKMNYGSQVVLNREVKF